MGDDRPVYVGRRCGHLHGGFLERFVQPAHGRIFVDDDQRALFLWLAARPGALLIASAILAGVLLNIPHSILLVMAQQLLPARKGVMGGAVLGFMFASGAATAWLASLLADQVGLGPVLTALGFVPIAAGVCALVLPSTGLRQSRSRSRRLRRLPQPTNRYYRRGISAADRAMYEDVQTGATLLIQRRLAFLRREGLDNLDRFI